MERHEYHDHHARSVRIREVLVHRALSMFASAEIWVGHGDGRACSVCHWRSEPGDFTFDVEIHSAGLVRLCAACRRAWDDAVSPPFRPIG